MATQAFFHGLVYDESDRIVETSYVGSEAFYVVDDQGFHRHVPADQIDRYVLQIFLDQLTQNKDIAVDQAMKMMGQDDIFTKAALDSQIDNVNMDQILKQGIPSQARDMMGMMGFKIVVNYRGEVVRFDQPSVPDDSDEW